MRTSPGVPPHRSMVTLVEELVGRTVGQALRSWSAMETVISVAAVVRVLILSLIV